jgi:chromate transporter
LLVLFFYPVWVYLKRYAAVYRSLEGINAAVVGIMLASSFYLLRDISVVDMNSLSITNLGVIAGTFLALVFSRLPSHAIVCVCLLLGILY